MPEEAIDIRAERTRGLKPLASLLGELGFTKISYSSELLSVEKLRGRDLQGKPFLEYCIEFTSGKISFRYAVPPEKNKTARLVELLPIFLNVLRLSEEYYAVKPSSIFPQLNIVLNELSSMVGRDMTELSVELSELKKKHAELSAKYDDLVSSSEKNARMLLECERKRDEVQKRLKSLESMSNEILKEELYEWIQVHGGNINIKEFSKSNMVPPQRVEEGLNMLIRDGYIKRRVV